MTAIYGLSENGPAQNMWKTRGRSGSHGDVAEMADGSGKRGLSLSGDRERPAERVKDGGIRGDHFKSCLGGEVS